MTDPASPEGMLRSYYGEDDTGLSAINEKPVDDRSIYQQVRDYLTSGINEDARYALGPHAAPAVQGIASLAPELTPAADVRDALAESQRTAEAAEEGNVLEAGIGGLSTLASLAAMAIPGSGAMKKGIKEIKNYVDEPVSYTFTTGRGSTYEAFPSGKTQRDKASGHKDGGVGLQRESEKTIFTDGSEQARRTASDIVGISKNDVPTQILPILNSKEEVIGIKLVHRSNLGPKKAGDTILQMPVSTKPNIGKQPIEIFNRGTDIHLGSSITEVKKVTEEAINFAQKKFPKMRESWWLAGNKDTVTLYHGTDVKNLNKIKKEGIAPDASNKTFLTPDPDTGVGYASMTGGEKTFRQVGKKAKTNPMENRRLLEIEVPRDVVIANMDKQSSKYSISKLLDPDARGKFKPYDKKENQPYYAKTEFSIEGGIPPQYIKGVSSKADPRKTKKKKAGGSVVERNHFNYPPRAI
mgnify:CR=1 FL=1|tara:strand:- start:36 stop:1436 length:1401 start_codon:yes stop_codon:yes gene_type:complete